MTSAAAKQQSGSRRDLWAAVPDENHTARGLGYGGDDDDDVKQPNERGHMFRKAACLQPLQSNDFGFPPQTSFCRSISTDSDLSDGDFDLRPLIKEELRNSIQKRQWQRGTLDIALEDYDKKRYRENKLTPEDIQKREDRKTRNREAATKCRAKRRKRHDELQETMASLETRRNELMQQKENLHREKLQLERMVEDHFRLCSYRPSMGLRGT